MSGAATRRGLRQPARDTGAGRDLRRAWPADGHSLRQRPGADQSSVAAWALEWKIDLRHIQPGKPTQNAHVASSPRPLARGLTADELVHQPLRRMQEHWQLPMVGSSHGGRFHAMWPTQ